mmetsp:Transcript_6875/g.30998  ORF Transcript_6875/g.30998 Transcript_6875/m.30998 type:complete len:256 (-) Transcript_6875:38-805(-)
MRGDVARRRRQAQRGAMRGGFTRAQDHRVGIRAVPPASPRRLGAFPRSTERARQWEREGSVEPREDARGVERRRARAHGRDHRPAEYGAAHGGYRGEERALACQRDARVALLDPSELQRGPDPGEEQAEAVGEEQRDGAQGRSRGGEEVGGDEHGEVHAHEGAPQRDERRLGHLEHVEDVHDHHAHHQRAHHQPPAVAHDHDDRRDQGQRDSRVVLPRAGFVPRWSLGRGRRRVGGPHGTRGPVHLAPNADGRGP